jgi:hypothetical protein
MARAGVSIQPNPSILSCSGEPGFQPTDICRRSLHNFIAQWPSVPEQENLPGYVHPSTNLNGTVLQRWCRCPGVKEDSRTVRASCRGGMEQCRPLASNITAPQWKQILSVPDRPEYRAQGTCQTNANCPAGSICIPVGNVRACVVNDWLETPSAGPYTYQFRNNNLAAQRLWDITTLGAGCAASDPALRGDVDCVAGYPRVFGVIWSNLRSMPNLPAAVGSSQIVPVATVNERGSYLWSGNTGYVTAWGGVLDDPNPWKQIRAPLDFRCWYDGCAGDPLTTVIFNPKAFDTFPNDPTRAVSPCLPGASGCRPISPDTLGTAKGVITDIWTKPDRLYVPAGEAYGRVGALGMTTQFVRGVAFNKNSGQLVQAIASNTTGGSLIGVTIGGEELLAFGAQAAGLVQANTSSGPTSILDPEGVSFSATRGEVVMLGSQNINQTNATLWFLGAAGWQNITLDLIGRPTDVLAATYHLGDDKYYAYDRALLHSRLGRWTRGKTAYETLAIWPSLWQAFDEYWLVSGHEDDLLLVATRDNSSALARMKIDRNNGRLIFAGVKLLTKRILTRPIGSIGKVVVVTDALPGASPKRELIRHSEFVGSNPWWPQLP